MDSELRINRKYKDRLFIYLFANEKNKRFTLELYNAVNGTTYNDPDEIDFELLEDIIYIGRKNDVSFLIHKQINLYEHQSTYNPNMPLRQLFYISNIYERYLRRNDISLYSSKRIDLPVPQFVVFYNGKEKKEEEIIMRLSDSYADQRNPQLELIVRYININHGYNEKVMKECRPLMEYSWLIDRIRNNEVKGKEKERAVRDAIMEMPKDFEIHNLIQSNSTEVMNMIVFDLNDEDEMRKYLKSVKEEVKEKK